MNIGQLQQNYQIAHRARLDEVGSPKGGLDTVINFGGDVFLLESPRELNVGIRIPFGTPEAEYPVVTADELKAARVVSAKGETRSGFRNPGALSENRGYPGSGAVERFFNPDTNANLIPHGLAEYWSATSYTPETSGKSGTLSWAARQIATEAGIADPNQATFAVKMGGGHHPAELLVLLPREGK